MEKDQKENSVVIDPFRVSRDYHETKAFAFLAISQCIRNLHERDTIRLSESSKNTSIAQRSLCEIRMGLLF